MNADSEEENKVLKNTSKMDQLPRISKYRKALPQFLAVSAKNLLLVSSSMTLAFPALVIPVLLASKDRLKFDETSASWFGSIAFMCQPIGSLLSGPMMEPLGRKLTMLIVNIPHLIGWYLFYSAFSIPILFLAAVLMGLGSGFMDAPVFTYVGEICEPNLRGILTSYSILFATVGFIFEFLLGTFYDWNTTALISSFIPLMTIIAISQVPESPMWLLSKGKIKEAEKSLCWLRGWVTKAYVQDELNDLIRYSNNSKLILKQKNYKSPTSKNEHLSNHDRLLKLDMTVGSNGDEDESLSKDNNCSILDIDRTTDSAGILKTSFNNGYLYHPVENIKNDTNVNDSTYFYDVERKPTIMELIRDLYRPQMLKPLILVTSLIVFYNGSGFWAMQLYMVIIFEDLKFPLEAHWATVVTSCVGFFGVIVCILFVRYVGKRMLTLTSLTGCAIALLSLSLWSFLKEYWDSTSYTWIPFSLFMFYMFSFSFGLRIVLWMIVSEVFPLRGRGYGSGVAAAILCIMGFMTSKTFLLLKSLFDLKGIFCFYGFIMVVGIIYFYFQLPETEGKTLEDIENLYNVKKDKR